MEKLNVKSFTKIGFIFGFIIALIPTILFHMQIFFNTNLGENILNESLLFFQLVAIMFIPIIIAVGFGSYIAAKVYNLLIEKNKYIANIIAAVIGIVTTIILYLIIVMISGNLVLNLFPKEMVSFAGGEGFAFAVFIVLIGLAINIIGAYIFAIVYNLVYKKTNLKNKLIEKINVKQFTKTGIILALIITIIPVVLLILFSQPNQILLFYTFLIISAVISFCSILFGSILTAKAYNMAIEKNKYLASIAGGITYVAAAGLIYITASEIVKSLSTYLSPELYDELMVISSSATGAAALNTIFLWMFMCVIGAALFGVIHNIFYKK